MNVASLPASGRQTDEALRLLADLYHRRFQREIPPSHQGIQLARWHAYEHVRNTLPRHEDWSKTVAKPQGRCERCQRSQRAAVYGRAFS